MISEISVVLRSNDLSQFMRNFSEYGPDNTDDQYQMRKQNELQLEIYWKTDKNEEK
jgi:hypothetical protein